MTETITTQVRFGGPHRLGRRGVCPFCGYIGPPQLCPCVTQLFKALKDALPTLDSDMSEHAAEVVVGHEERVRVLNDELRLSGGL